MNERIQKLTALTLDGKMCPNTENIDFDREDMFLSEHERQSKRIREYIAAQKPVLTEYQTMTGLLKFEISDKPPFSGDFMHCFTLKNTREAFEAFYTKPIDNLSSLEWEHATADFESAIRSGLRGIIEKINRSLEKYAGDEEKAGYLKALRTVAGALIDWAHRCAAAARALSETVQNTEYRENLEKLSETLMRVPEYPAESFYEAVLSIYILFGCEPDSVGTLDRTLRPYYERDREKGVLTEEKATEILQELFLMLQANTPKGSSNFTKGGESHFCVGGYDENGNDTFDDFSRLILKAVTALPTYIPQVSLRWTKKLPFETFLSVLRMAVSDPNNRIAFVNDEAKIHAVMHIADFPFEKACRYTSVGCNEVAYPGSFYAGATQTNVFRSLENLLYEREEELCLSDTWEKFFELYKKELFSDIDKMLWYDDQFMKIRGRDISYVTSLLFPDCIESGKSFTSGGCRYAVSGVSLIGLTNVFDSLSVIKQFVYDEKTVDMKTLLSALKNDWNGYEELHTRILKTGKFFGNDDETSNGVARLFCDTLYSYTENKRSALGYPYIFGNLIGYRPYHRWFGSNMRATPDGRKAGEDIKFGLGQSGGYDREGLTALLNSIAFCDTHGIISGGPSVTNLYFDEKLVRDEENIPKTAKLLETYFQNGGSHFQLNYVSREDLIKAKKDPTPYKNLRVRVSGFSDYFVNLEDPIQDDIIRRTVKNG